MKQMYEAEILNKLMERDGFNIPSSIPPYESEIKAYLINQVKLAYPKLTDYEAEWLLYNYTKHLPAEFPISSVTDVMKATFENVVPFAFKSAILSGMTLINLARQNFKNIQISTDENVTIGQSSKYVLAKFSIDNIVKPNTKYNLRLNSKFISGDIEANHLKICFYNASSYITETSFYSPKDDGAYNIIFTTPNDCNSITLALPRRTDSMAHTSTYEYSDGLLIEYQDGMENWDIPYFEGMQSVKMPVLTTTGKNLFDGKLEKGYIDGSGGYKASSTAVRSINYIGVKPNTNYIISSESYTGNVYVHEYDVNHNHINEMALKSFTTSSNAHYIKFNTNNNTNTDLTAKFQIEQNTQSTTYEAYKINILTVNEDITLRGIGEGSNRVEDELNCLTGEVTERIGEIVLDGSEDWVLMGTSTDGLYNRFLLALNDKMKSSLILCDKIKGEEWNWWNPNKDNPPYNAIFGHSDLYHLNLVIKISEAADVASLKTYLQSNPLKTQYQLATESIKTVDLTTVNENGEKVYFMPLEGTMHVQSSGETIQPTFDVSVPIEATTQNLASFINLEMEE